MKSVKIIANFGTEWEFPCDGIIQHEIEDEPGRFSLVFERPNRPDFHIESHKDLRVYIMNNEGKTINRRFYQK